MQLNYGAKCVIPKKISPHLAFFYHVEIMHSTQMKLCSNSIVQGNSIIIAKFAMISNS